MGMGFIGIILSWILSEEEYGVPDYGMERGTGMGAETKAFVEENH